MYGLRRENRFAPFRPHTMVAHLIRLDARSRFMVDGEMGGDPEPPRDSGKPPQCLSGPGACRASDGRAANPSARSTIRRFWIHGAAMGLHIPENFSSLSRIFASTTKARQAPRCRVPDEYILHNRSALLIGREVLVGLLSDLSTPSIA